MADLTTLATVKQWLRITTATDDALLANMLSAASSYIIAWLNRDLFSQLYDITVDGANRNRFLLPDYPVTAVQWVTVDGLAVPAAAGMGNGYVFNETSVSLRGYRAGVDYGNVRLQYTAGYAVIPLDLQRAAVELVALRYREIDRIGMVSKTLAGETVTYTQKDFTDAIKGVLLQYRRVIPV